MTKFKQFAVLSGMVFFVLFFIAGCTSSGSSSGITVTFSPVNGATDVAVDAAVTATFSAAITEPADWSTVFTLILDGTGLPLCTSVTYNSTTRVATCAHAAFGIGSDYTAAISGLTSVTDATTSFTTTSTVAVTGFSKTSITTPTDGSGETTLTFTLSGALPLGATPILAMSGGTAGTCTISADSLTITCPVTGLAGCTTFTDYTATLSGGMTGHSVTFNSADDEFTSGDVITNDCYTYNITPETIISNGVLTLTAVGAGVRSSLAKGPTVGTPNLIQATYINTFTPGNIGDMFNFVLQDGASHDSAGFASLYYTFDPAQQWIKSGNDAGEAATIDTSIWPTEAVKAAGLYFCVVHANGLINLYLSTDGTSYTRLTPDNMNCFSGDTCTVFDIPTASWSTLTSGLMVQNIAGDANLSTVLSFTRFSSAPTADGATDCANLTAY